MSAAADALRPGGRLIFTVERAPESATTLRDGYHLTPQGRYSHEQNYISCIISEAGLTLEFIENVELRKEMGSPVEGLLVTAMAKHTRTSEMPVSRQMNSATG
jgi:predicted TPR repeat methyltransferase